jgi:hypothetical protein
MMYINSHPLHMKINYGYFTVELLKENKEESFLVVLAF